MFIAINKEKKKLTAEALLLRIQKEHPRIFSANTKLILSFLELPLFIHDLRFVNQCCAFDSLENIIEKTDTPQSITRKLSLYYTSLKYLHKVSPPHNALRTTTLNTFVFKCIELVLTNNAPSTKISTKALLENFFKDYTNPDVFKLLNNISKMIVSTILEFTDNGSAPIGLVDWDTMLDIMTMKIKYAIDVFFE